jgi:2-methylisocitrate lyase-like PEP mutase family enzyme
LGFQALATTSSGLAYSLGADDGSGYVNRELALANARYIAQAVSIPVSADLENLYAHEPAVAAATIPFAAAAGVIGCSIEDATGDKANPIYDFDYAVRRVKAAVMAARSLSFPFTLTARAENFLHGRKDLDDTIARLKAFEEAGADCLYAPGLPDMDAVRAVVSAVTKPINVLVSSYNADMSVEELGAAGVRRISVGGALNRAAWGGFLQGAKEIAEKGTFTYGRTVAAPGAEVVRLIGG